VIRLAWLWALLSIAGPASAGSGDEMELAAALAESSLTRRAVLDLDEPEREALADHVRAIAHDDASERDEKTTALRVELVEALRQRDEDYREDIAELEDALKRFAQFDGGQLLRWFNRGRERGAILRFERWTLARAEAVHAVAAARVAIEAWRRDQLPHSEAAARLAWAARLDDDYALWMELAEFLHSDDDPHAVLAAAERALELARTDEERVAALLEVGAAREELGHPLAAVAALEDRGRLLDTLREADPDDEDLARQQLVGDLRLARLHRSERSVSDGIPPAERALRIARELGARFPDSLEWRRHAADALHLLADIRASTGHLDGVGELFEAELAVRMELVDVETPRDADRFALADAHWWLGGLAEREGRFDEAKDRYEAGTAIVTALASDDPDDSWTANRLGSMVSHLGRLDARLGRFRDGARRFRQGFSVLRRQALDNPRRRTWTWSLADLARDLADAERRAKRERSAAGLLETAASIEADRVAHTADVEVPLDSTDWGDFELLAVRARVAARGGAWAEARDLRERAVAVLERVMAIDPDNRDIEAEWIEERAGLVAIHRELGDLATAARLAAEVAADWDELHRAAPSDVQWATARAEAWHRLGELRMAQGEIASGNAALGTAITQWQALLEIDGRVVRWKEGLAASVAARQY